MTRNCYDLPQPLGRLLSLLPAYPGSLLFAAGINLFLAEKLPSDVRLALTGKKFRLHVIDAQLCFDFEWAHSRFSACRRSGAPDLTVSANAHDFLRMAQCHEDPDTLFFSRRLVMEGDTELGLIVKNTLDAIDPLIPAELRPSEAFAYMKAAFTPDSKWIGIRRRKEK